MPKNGIEWTEQTWNCLSGCSKVSPGCRNCYAEEIALKFQQEYLNGNSRRAGYKDGFKLTLHPHRLNEALKRKKPTKYFVNSMSDIFHKDVPESYIHQMFEVMNKAYWHQFQILTKRHERLLELSPKLNWTPNIWQGVYDLNLTGVKLTGIHRATMLTELAKLGLETSQFMNKREDAGREKKTGKG